MFQKGFILNWRSDLIWFLALPYWATAAALACQQWLPSVALASVALWITVPHHFATWLRTYGVREDWRRWRDRLVLGPLVIVLLTIAGLTWTPLTLALVVLLWDHQHSVMQQHGFARIYDFKARTGAPWTPRWDLWLNWVLYGNLLLTMPLFTAIWLRELAHWQVPVSMDAFRTLRLASWVVTAGFVCVYFLQTGWSVRQGYALNPIKYVFIASSYFLWYFVSSRTDSVLVYGIAHRLMHGLQYIVIVYWFLRRRVPREESRKDIATRLVQPANLVFLFGAALLYAAAYQLIAGKPLDEFGFGLVAFMAHYASSQPAPGIEPMSYAGAYDIMAATIINGLAMIHYYVDSFIWKVRDTKTQAGL